MKFVQRKDIHSTRKDIDYTFLVVNIDLLSKQCY